MGLARRGVLSGVCLFDRNFGSAAELKELVREVDALFPADLAPIIAVDQEGGRVQRLKPPKVPEVDRVPTMREAAALGRDGLQALGEKMGRDLRRFGINVNFAPVLDVATNPANPVIGDRAFGDRPEAVIAGALAFARGLDAVGVVPCGKHFPGHGDTVADSHLALPRVPHDLARLAAVELPPFAAWAEARMPMLMTAHVIYEALDRELPATLSPFVVSPIVRPNVCSR